MADQYGEKITLRDDWDPKSNFDDSKKDQRVSTAKDRPKAGDLWGYDTKTGAGDSPDDAYSKAADEFDPTRKDKKKAKST